MMLRGILLAGLCIVLQACSSGSGKEDPEEILARANDRVIKISPNQKVFRYKFDAVWRAAQLALKYPIAINNIDNGTLETEWIKAADGFQSPTSSSEPSNGVRYKIGLTIVKGKVEGKESTRVTIIKHMEKRRDFFSDPEAFDSDGLEEKVIFYRIEREVLIDEGLKKASQPGAAKETK